MQDRIWEEEILNRAERFEYEAAMRRRDELEATRNRKLSRIFAAAGITWLLMLAVMLTWRAS